MDTKGIGDITVAEVLSALLKKKKVVLIPFGDNQRYDLVFYENGKFYRVQCKTGRLINGVIVFNTKSVSLRKNGTNLIRGYKDEVDFFGIYCPQLDKTYLVPIDTIASYGGLRVGEKKGLGGTVSKWAKDHEL